MSLSLELKGAKSSLLGSISVKLSAFPVPTFPRPSLQKMHHFTGPWCLRAFEPVLYIAAAEFFYSNRPVYVGTTSASQSEEREQQWLANKNCGKQYPW